MSARTRFLPRREAADVLRPGDVVGKRLGLHAGDPGVRWVVRRVTTTSVKVECCSRSRGSRKRDRMMTFSAAQAYSMLVRLGRTH